jgi:DNA-binding transcriptional LysR family regulator
VGMGTLERLARIDLNLLGAFHAVERTRHVTLAARSLGLSQPALSHALARLRRTMGDPLFVKTPSGMQLTPLAITLGPIVADVLGKLDREVFDRRPFTPKELARTFRIRTTDLVETLVAPHLFALSEDTAPNVRWAFLPVGTTLPKAELETGECDLAVAGFFGALPAGYYQKVLLTDSFASAISVDHPLASKKTIGLAAFAAERHVMVAPGGALAGDVDRALAKAGVRRVVVLGSSTFLASAWITARSRAVLTGPRRILSRMAEPLGLRLFPPPVPLKPIRVVAVWHGRNHQDEAHCWFRQRLFEAPLGDEA